MLERQLFLTSIFDKTLLEGKIILDSWTKMGTKMLITLALLK